MIARYMKKNDKRIQKVTMALFSEVLFYSTEVYPWLSQVSKTERFAAIVKG